jgi:hypothetical protein
MQAYLDQAAAVLESGFTQINATMGLLIALAATIFLRSWNQWIPAAFVATFAHIAIEHVTGLVRDKKELALPELLTAQFWSDAGVLLVGYLLVIGIFFFAKRVLMTAFAGGGQASAKKH